MSVGFVPTDTHRIPRTVEMSKGKVPFAWRLFTQHRAARSPARAQLPLATRATQMQTDHSITVSSWLNGCFWSTAKTLVWYCDGRHRSVCVPPRSFALLHPQTHACRLMSYVTGQNGTCCVPVMRKCKCRGLFCIYRFSCVLIHDSGISPCQNILSQHQEPRFFLFLVKP